MSVENDLGIILVKKLGYLETRVTYLEGKCRGQQSIIEILLEKLEKIGKENGSQDELILSQVLEDSVDLKPDVNSIQMLKSNENLKGNYERYRKNDKKLNQKLIVQMGLRCQINPLISNRAINQKTKISRDQKTVEISSKLKGSVKKSHFCNFCSKSFPSFSKLSDHMRVHTRERPFKCQICSKSFTVMGSLSIHSRIHTGEKPYSCSLCSKSFTQISSIKCHMRIHTGEKPYSCSICSRSFSKTSSVKDHMRTHTGEKPFSCSFCSKTFAQIGNRNEHIRAHIGEKPYSCSVCSKTFAKASALSRHSKLHKGEK